MATASNPNVPGMTDTLDFVKNLWGSMNVPGFSVPGMPGPTLSTDDLDKKISDLKAVESWLNLNTTMLRGTIQALEVQRATLATFKSMSASMAQAMGQPGTDGKPGAAPFFHQPGAGAPAAEAGAPQAEGAAAGATQEVPPGAAAMPAALAWWNLLQDQFQQAVTGAMSAQATAGAAAADAAAGGPAASQDTAAGQGADAASAKPRASKPKAEKS